MADVTFSHWRLLFHVSDQPIKSHFAGDQPISFSDRHTVGFRSFLTGFSSDLRFASQSPPANFKATKRRSVFRLLSLRCLGGKSHLRQKKKAAHFITRAAKGLARVMSLVTPNFYHFKGQSKRLNLVTPVVIHISAGVMLPNSGIKAVSVSTCLKGKYIRHEPQ